MIPKSKLKIEREVKTFWDLHHGANVLLEKTKENKEGSYYTTMSSLILIAFTFEAYLNHLGREKIKHWDEIDSIRVLDKYSVLCKEFEVEITKGKRPYQTIKSLFDFRNAIAHGKSQIIIYEDIVPIETNIRDIEVKTKWEEFCTEENAVRCIEDIETAIKELHTKSGEEGHPFTSGITIGSIS